MKKIRNYKNIRRKPQIWGFTPTGFYIFIAVASITLFSFAISFSFMQLIVVLIINVMSLIATRLLISNEQLVQKFLNEKFPSEISDLTLNSKKK